METFFDIILILDFIAMLGVSAWWLIRFARIFRSYAQAKPNVALVRKKITKELLRLLLILLPIAIISLLSALNCSMPMSDDDNPSFMAAATGGWFAVLLLSLGLIAFTDSIAKKFGVEFNGNSFLEIVNVALQLLIGFCFGYASMFTLIDIIHLLLFTESRVVKILCDVILIGDVLAMIAAWIWFLIKYPRILRKKLNSPLVLSMEDRVETLEKVLIVPFFVSLAFFGVAWLSAMGATVPLGSNSAITWGFSIGAVISIVGVFATGSYFLLIAKKNAVTSVKPKGRFTHSRNLFLYSPRRVCVIISVGIYFFFGLAFSFALTDVIYILSF